MLILIWPSDVDFVIPCIDIKGQYLYKHLMLFNRVSEKKLRLKHVFRQRCAFDL